MESNVALQLLDTCMKHCGVGFHTEVGKFRFLNEMIKLVSPKYLGEQTALAVKQRVLLLMHTWTLDYPRETKIKEAYDMLKKQGVIKVCWEDVRYLRTALFWVIMRQVIGNLVRTLRDNLSVPSSGFRNPKDVRYLRTALFWVIMQQVIGNFVRTLRDDLSVPSSGFRNPKESM